MKFLKKIWRLIKDKKAKVNLDDLTQDSNLNNQKAVDEHGLYETPSMKIAKKYVRETSNPSRKIKTYQDAMNFFHDVRELPRKLKKKILREFNEEIVKEHYGKGDYRK